MILIVFVLVVAFLSPVRGIRSAQKNDVRQLVIPLLNASVSGAAKEALRVYDLLPTTAQSSQTATPSPLTNNVKSTPSSETYNAMIGTETASRKSTLTEDSITSSIAAKSTDLPALIFSSQTIKPDSRNEYTLVHGQTPTPTSTSTPGSDSSATFIAPKTIPTQSQLVFKSSASHLPPIAPTSTVSKLQPLLTLGGQSITASSPDQYNINGQTLTPGAVATVSDTSISMAPKASDSGAAHSTNIPNTNTNTTAGSNSGSAGTSVQVFKGGVLGGRDGLWSPSVVLLMEIAVLLWL